MDASAPQRKTQTTHRTDLLIGYEELGVTAFLLHDMLSEEECDFIIETVLDVASHESKHCVPSSLLLDLGGGNDVGSRLIGSLGQMKRTSKGDGYNRKDRYLFGSEELATVLWHRMEPYLRESVGDGVEIIPAKESGSCFRDADTGLSQRRIQSRGEAVMQSCGETSARLDVQDLVLTTGEWVGKWQPAFCNPIFEVMSYAVGGCFRPHVDANLLYKERIDELRNAFSGRVQDKVDPDRLSSRSLYTVLVYLTGKHNESDPSPPFAGGETNLLENSYREKLLYCDDDGNFEQSMKRVFATVLPQRGTALIFYQRGLLHEGADVSERQGQAVLAKEYLTKKIILRSDVFFTKEEEACASPRGFVPEGCHTSGHHVSDADCARAEALIEESEEFEESGDFETAASLYEQAMGILGRGNN